MKVAFLKPPIGGILGLEMLTFVEPLGPISVAGGLEAEGHECRSSTSGWRGWSRGWPSAPPSRRPWWPPVQLHDGAEPHPAPGRAGAARAAGGVHPGGRARRLARAGVVPPPAIDAIAVGDGEE